MTDSLRYRNVPVKVQKIAQAKRLGVTPDVFQISENKWHIQFICHAG
jgi:hypothetical protein